MLAKVNKIINQCYLYKFTCDSTSQVIAGWCRPLPAWRVPTIANSSDVSFPLTKASRTAGMPGYSDSTSGISVDGWRLSWMIGCRLIGVSWCSSTPGIKTSSGQPWWRRLTLSEYQARSNEYSYTTGTPITAFDCGHFSALLLLSHEQYW